MYIFQGNEFPSRVPPDGSFPPTWPPQHEARYSNPSQVQKEPGLIRGALQTLAAVSLSNTSSSSLDQQNRKKHFSALQSPIHSPSPCATSPTDSSWEGASSRGPSRLPSQPASHAPSMSAGVSGRILAPWSPVFVPVSQERRASRDSDAPFVTPSQKPGFVHSDKAEGGHKFSLRDLLASGPKLRRKSSQPSSSKKSNSDTGDGRARSTSGDSVVGLTLKYGVRQKLAIGKGVMSVVKLAHKWDRSEEKLYAIKVSSSPLSVVFNVIN